MKRKTDEYKILNLHLLFFDYKLWSTGDFKKLNYCKVINPKSLYSIPLEVDLSGDKSFK